MEKAGHRRGNRSRRRGERPGPDADHAVQNNTCNFWAPFVRSSLYAPNYLTTPLWARFHVQQRARSLCLLLLAALAAAVTKKFATKYTWSCLRFIFVDVRFDWNECEFRFPNFKWKYWPMVMKQLEEKRKNISYFSSSETWCISNDTIFEVWEKLPDFYFILFKFLCTLNGRTDRKIHS